MAKSTVSRRQNKPKKPNPQFPLYAHNTRRWAKRIRGKIHYFGPWDHPDSALQKYLDQKDDLHAGRTPRINGEGLTIRDLCNRFLTAKRHLLDTGEIRIRTFQNYHRSCEKIVSHFGRNRLVSDLATDDFEHFRSELAKGRGPVALGNEIRHVRIVFKYGYDAGLIDRTVRFGPTFKLPSKRILRQARYANGPRMFEVNELRTIIKSVRSPLKAMILLGINCGYGQTDVANLPSSNIDFDTGWIDYPRPKTAILRRCPLWKETIQAGREAIQLRPEPKDEADGGLVFLTKYGNRWVRSNFKGTQIDSVALEFGKVLRQFGLKRNKINFYALRHTFETIARESKDQVAVNSIMGHVDSSMAGVYRERISDERLTSVVDTVHKWLFSEKV